MKGSNLIFLISQPRAGSTLLQFLLSSHPDIYTSNTESWIMLHPLYAIKNKGINTDYDSTLAKMGLDDFLTQIPEKEDLFYSAVRKYANTMYNRVLKLSDKRLFLDKTPRYYNVIPELFKTFPKAKFLILLRNPMASLASMLTTWFRNNIELLKISPNYLDVIKGPQLLIDGIKYLGSNAIVTQYEDIVSKTEESLINICNRIKIPYTKDLLTYETESRKKPRLGDPVGVYKYDKPFSPDIDKWTKALSKPELIDFSRQYLESLGPELINQMGYSFDEIMDKLVSHNTSLQSKNSTSKMEGHNSALISNINTFIEKVTILVEQGNISEAIRYYNQQRPNFENVLPLIKIDKMIESLENKISQRKNPGLPHFKSHSVNSLIDTLNSDKHNHDAANKLLIQSNEPSVFKASQKALTEYLDNNINESFLQKFVTAQEKYFDWQLHNSVIVETNYKKKDYLISAIVSTYNSESFIKECLEDLEGQTVSEDLEIIIIDANSPENERKTMEQFQGKFSNIKYVRTDTRIGIYAAWNLAIRVASGRFLTPFSTNDRLRKNAYEILSQSLINNPEIMLVYGDTHITETPHETFEQFTPAKVYNGAFRWPDYHFLDLVRFCRVGPHPMWRSDVTKTIGYFNENYKAIADQDYWLRIGEQFNLLHINEFTGLYYFTESGLSIQDGSKEEIDQIHEKYKNRFLLRNNITFEMALMEFINDINKLFIKGEQYYNKSDFKSAFKCFKEVIGLNPKHFRAYTHLGILSKQFCDNETAYLMFLHAVIVNPTYTPALKELWSISKIINKKQEALSHIQKALKLDPNLTEIKELLNTD